MSPAVVEAELRVQVPELADGRVALAHCRVSRIRSLDVADTWTAIYELELHDNSSGLDWVFATQGVITPPDHALTGSVSADALGTVGWYCTLEALHLQLQAVRSADELPGLTAITDPARARDVLASVFRGRLSAADDPHVIESVAADVVSEKPGVRATVVCELTYGGLLEPSGDWPARVVVKVHNDEEGARAFAALGALWSAGLGTDDRIRIARPLGYLPELRMVVQEHLAHERTLKDVIKRAFVGDDPVRRADLAEALRQVAVALAAVHTCGSRHGASVSFAEELAVVRTKAARLAAVVPGLEARLAAAFSAIERAAAGPADPDAPIHHSFRPAQVLLGDRVSIIDFDKSSRGEAASDLASLTTKLLHMGVNKSGSVAAAEFEARLAALADLRAVFVDAYAAAAPVSPNRMFAWEALELVSLVLSATKKAEDGHFERCAELLDRHLTRAGS